MSAESAPMSAMLSSLCMVVDPCAYHLFFSVGIVTPRSSTITGLLGAPSIPSVCFHKQAA